MSDRETALKARIRELITAGDVSPIIGYGKTFDGKGVRPLFVRSAADADGLVWNEYCGHNLSTYLLREPCLEVLRKGGRVGIVAKGCDVRAILVLLQERQIKRGSVHIIGVTCDGMRDADSADIQVRCRACEYQTPHVYDDLIGDESRVRPVVGDRFEDLARIEAMTPGERWQFWTEAFSRCIKCYACRQACPLCYCRECITEKSRPQWIDKAPSLKGNLAYHFIRAMHLAGRCISCGQCSRACPMDIPVDMLSTFLSRKVDEAYGYKPGMDTEADPFFVTYADDDPEDFVR
ncbi:MAG: 4Fe-4S dicluster domain-containing protein [Candidatus Eisenbacteria bacterium]